jgi:TonB family protein
MVNKKLFLLVFSFIAFTFILNAQTKTERFFKDKYLNKEVTESKANYKLIIYKNLDETITSDVIDLNNDKTIRSSTFKGEEPCGIWISEYEKPNFDFNFHINYSDAFCNDCYKDSLVKDFFENNDTINYKAPVLSYREKNIYEFLAQNINYPAFAKENNIQGQLYLSFIIDENATISDIRINKGVHILLDKETVRVLRSMKFASPCMLQNKPIKVQFKLPFLYRLDN